jgi:AcrR family transcriptional regulator
MRVSVEGRVSGRDEYPGSAGYAVVCQRSDPPGFSAAFYVQHSALMFSDNNAGVRSDVWVDSPSDGATVPMKEDSALSASGTQLGSKGQRQRKLILKISREMFEEDGLEGLALRRVAAQAGMKLGNLQYYFSTKDELLEGLMRDIFGEDQRTVLAGYPEGDFEGVFRHLLDIWETDIGRIYLGLFGATGRRSRFRVLKREIYVEFYELLIGLLRIRNPDLGHEELLVKAKQITAVLDGTVLQEHASDRARADVQRRELHDHVVKILMFIVNE